MLRMIRKLTSELKLKSKGDQQTEFFIEAGNQSGRMLICERQGPHAVLHAAWWERATDQNCRKGVADLLPGKSAAALLTDQLY